MTLCLHWTVAAASVVLFFSPQPTPLPQFISLRHEYMNELELSRRLFGRIKREKN